MDSNGNWPLKKHQSICCWQVSETEESSINAEEEPHIIDADYNFINGFVAVGDFPSRKWIKQLRLKKDYPCNINFHEIHLNHENPHIDFSQFSHTPVKRHRYLKTELFSSSFTECHFNLQVTGYVTIWCNQKYIGSYSPFVRNIASSFDLSIPLSIGSNELVIEFGDVHERDTTSYFSLTLLSDSELSYSAGKEMDFSTIEHAHLLLKSISSNQLFYSATPIYLTLEHEIETSFSITASARSFNGNHTVILPTQLNFTPQIQTVLLAELTEIPAGAIQLDMAVEVEGFVLKHSFGIIISKPLFSFSGALEQRKIRLAQHLVQQKTDNPLSLALLLLREGVTERAIPMIEDALHKISIREDCADFLLLPLLVIYKDFKQQLPGSLVILIEQTILNFRYWLDEPGNDVMWFWSENHAFCFHIAQYAVGNMFSDNFFTNAQHLGHEHAHKGKDRLNRWFDAIEKNGLAEWNSTSYYPIDIIALLCLRELSTDSDITERTNKLLDNICCMMALHASSGVATGSMGRSYEKEQFAGPSSELGAISQLLWGDRYLDSPCRTSALFVYSDYEPTQEMARLANPAPSDIIQAYYCQGYNQYSKLRLWKTKDIQLSTAVNHSPGTPGHQQHIVDVTMSANPFARFWVNHPGDLDIWGELRPSYWAGNGILPHAYQRENIASLIFDLSEHPIDFTHAFLPTEICDQVVSSEHWLFAQVKTGYIAIYSSTPLVPLKVGLYKGSEWRSYARSSAWLIYVGSEALHGSFEDFQTYASKANPKFEPHSKTLTFNVETKTIVHKFNSAVEVNGKSDLELFQNTSPIVTRTELPQSTPH